MLRCEKSRPLVKSPDQVNSNGPCLIHHHSDIDVRQVKENRTTETNHQCCFRSSLFPSKEVSNKDNRSKDCKNIDQLSINSQKEATLFIFNFQVPGPHYKIHSFSNSALEFCVLSLEVSMTFKKV